jgi:hypothetical protein
MHSSYWSPVRFVLLSLLLVLASVPNESLGQSRSSPLNEVVLEQIKQMPTGGRYSASRIATVRLQSAVHFEAGRFVIQPDAASPSYCSGATYLVFLKTIEALRDRGELQLNPETIESLLIRGQRDGQGIWGRWNANGPTFLRAWARAQLRRFRPSAAGRFHENLLVGGSRARGTRAFCHLSRDGEEVGARLCALLVKQYSVRLR